MKSPKIWLPDISGPTENALFNIAINCWHRVIWVLWGRRIAKQKEEMLLVATAIIGIGGYFTYRMLNRKDVPTLSREPQFGPPSKEPNIVPTHIERHRIERAKNRKNSRHVPILKRPAFTNLNNETGNKVLPKASYPFEVVAEYRGETGELRKGAVYRFKVHNRQKVEVLKNIPEPYMKKSKIKIERYL